MERTVLTGEDLLSLDAGGARGLVLPQLGMQAGVDYPREALHPMRSEWSGV